MLGEAESCELLHALFRARGYQTRADVAFAEQGVEFDADGWDPDARVGFEFLCSAAADHDDLSPDELARLAARMERGELFFFVIDESEVPDAQTLQWAAGRFLDEVERRRGGAT
ncbi:MAG TPA: hypothetical protein VGB85_12330 [Nannocystis sp.]|jgi:hypothetical protein